MVDMWARSKSWKVLLIASWIGLPGSETLAPGVAQAEPRTIELTRTDDQRPAHQAQAAASLGHALIAAIESWLVVQFDLPLAQGHPRIELVPAAKIAALRYRGLAPNARTEIVSSVQAASERDIVAVYSDAAHTIYLPEGWTGSTAAELSILVHEMVHHLQNAGRLTYECPQAREKVAYMAQERWLGLFGRSLEQDFELDGFSLLVKTRCM
jgi:hypothetical protein